MGKQFSMFNPKLRPILCENDVAIESEQCTENRQKCLIICTENRQKCLTSYFCCEMDFALQTADFVQILFHGPSVFTILRFFFIF